MDSSQTLSPTRAQLSRLMKIWRSAGWPCHDGLELDLIAAGWVEPVSAATSGLHSLRLSTSGIQVLAAARRRNLRAASAHDQLAERVVRSLQQNGRVVWRELSLRAQVSPAAGDTTAAGLASDGLAPPELPGFLAEASAAPDPTPAPQASGAKAVWRMARPDVFSVRNTSVQAYLQPVVHEVKVSRADLLSDLRHVAKRESYQWLCSECFYVFPVGIAEPQEIPEDFGIWVLHGDVADGRLELLRPARHRSCELPFAVWMALAKAHPAPGPEESAQAQLGGEAEMLLPDVPDLPDLPEPL
ncbi:hypothetical protein [Paucibacter sp. Y2R2-4]|uniref:hypothetical protein n=1 Tax=Paucibacter sp. Y2R2-4 TaxID=2893553 RepID=UPI0021E45D8E|nr:hypothetical protein [Paucibacter sp. Y2R2-4]MCV2352417.1 hypothetical protein [Paucibacter sp. Y2R2-4]